MSGFLSTAGQTLFQLSYQISPIFLTGGVAQGVLGGVMPIVLLTEGLDFALSALNGSVPDSLDDYFAQFMPLPGSTLIENEIGKYPFANQSVAANAIIAQPLHVSLEMVCPVRSGTYAGKLLTITNMQNVLVQHNSLGGLYTVATPAFIWTNCILRRVVDISGGETKQRQWRYQWDFEQPLVTLQQAQAAQNSLMNSLSNGTQTNGQTTGPGLGVGNPALNMQPFQGANAEGGLAA